MENYCPYLYEGLGLWPGRGGAVWRGAGHRGALFVEKTSGDTGMGEGKRVGGERRGRERVRGRTGNAAISTGTRWGRLVRTAPKRGAPRTTPSVASPSVTGPSI